MVATIHYGRSPSEWQLMNIDGAGAVHLVEGLTFFDNFFDNYTVILTETAKGYEQIGWMPSIRRGSRFPST